MTEKYPTWLEGHVKEWAEKRLPTEALCSTTGNELLKVWYLDMEHEQFHPLVKWDDFITDPSRYLNGMIEGAFEESGARP